MSSGWEYGSNVRQLSEISKINSSSEATHPPHSPKKFETKLITEGSIKKIKTLQSNIKILPEKLVFRDVIVDCGKIQSGNSKPKSQKLLIKNISDEEVEVRGQLSQAQSENMLYTLNFVG